MAPAVMARVLEMFAAAMGTSVLGDETEQTVVRTVRQFHATLPPADHTQLLGGLSEASAPI